MRNVSIARRASILILKCAFLASGLLSIWLICGAIETPELWWLYAMAAFGAFCGACLMLEVPWRQRIGWRQRCPRGFRCPRLSGTAPGTLSDEVQTVPPEAERPRGGCIRLWPKVLHQGFLGSDPRQKVQSPSRAGPSGPQPPKVNSFPASCRSTIWSKKKAPARTASAKRYKMDKSLPSPASCRLKEER